MSVFKCDICGIWLPLPEERILWNVRYYCAGTPDSDCMTLAKRSDAWKRMSLADIWDD